MLPNYGLSVPLRSLPNSISKILQGLALLVKSWPCDWSVRGSGPLADRIKAGESGGDIGLTGGERCIGSVIYGIQDCFLLVEEKSLRGPNWPGTFDT